jgi:hypothetical protein
VKLIVFSIFFCAIMGETITHKAKITMFFILQGY